MTKNKKIIIGIIIVVLIFAVALTIWQKYHRPIIIIEPPEGVSSSEWSAFHEDWQPMVEKISVWQNGQEWIINPESSEYIAIGRILLPTLHKLNLQARCVFSEESIQEIKRENRAIEMVFNQAEDFPISSWIPEEERYHIPTDENGYRILENLKSAIFVLEDNLDEGKEGHVLVGSEAKDKKDRMWGCWAIQQEGSNELDKIWIDEINKILIRESKEFCGWSTYAKCETDADCNMGGCSGQVCEGNGEGTITDCMMRDCYKIGGYECGCIDNKCQWSK